MALPISPSVRGHVIWISQVCRSHRLSIQGNKQLDEPGIIVFRVYPCGNLMSSSEPTKWKPSRMFSMMNSILSVIGLNVAVLFSGRAVGAGVGAFGPGEPIKCRFFWEVISHNFLSFHLSNSHSIGTHQLLTVQLSHCAIRYSVLKILKDPIRMGKRGLEKEIIRTASTNDCFRLRRSNDKFSSPKT